MVTITNEFMQEMLQKTKTYSIVLLKGGPNENIPERQQIVWEHGRRNFQLRAEGVLPIVCPVMNHETIRGVGIFDATKEEVKKIMDEDPGVQRGVFVYEILSCRSFPGAVLA